MRTDSLLPVFAIAFLNANTQCNVLYLFSLNVIFCSFKTIQDRIVIIKIDNSSVITKIVSIHVRYVYKK